MAVTSSSPRPHDDLTGNHRENPPSTKAGAFIVVKPGPTHRYHVPGQAARTIAALLTLRDQVIAPILAGVHRPGPGRPPKTHTRIDRDYENLRTGMRTLFNDLAINAAA